MKVAIVHDWLVTYAGAERVLASLCAVWPDADLFAVIDFLCDEDRAHWAASAPPRPSSSSCLRHERTTRSTCR